MSEPSIPFPLVGGSYRVIDGALVREDAPPVDEMPAEPPTEAPPRRRKPRED